MQGLHDADHGGNEEHEGGHVVQEGAQKEKHDQNEEHDKHLAVRESDDELGEVLRHLLGGDEKAEEVGCTHEEEDEGRVLGSLHKDAAEGFPSDGAVDEETDDESVQAGHGCGLGGREYAGVDAAQNDERHEQGQNALTENMAGF